MHSKNIYPHAHWICWISWYRPHPFLPCLFAVNLRNIANLLFWTPPRRFHPFALNFAHSICGLSWQKVIKIILIFQTILKLLNNNFLSTLLKTQSVAYLHTNLSDYFPMSHLGSVQNFVRWPLVDTLIGQIKTKLGIIIHNALLTIAKDSCYQGDSMAPPGILTILTKTCLLHAHTWMKFGRHVYHHQTHKKHPPHQTVTPAGRSTCEVPIVFWMTTFASQIITFFTTWTYPKLTKFGIYITPAREIHNQLLSSVSTIRWRYNQGKCVLAYNSHVLCRTFKNCIYSALQKYSAPLELFHILSHCNHKCKCILLGFYVIYQHKMVHNCEVEGHW